MSGTAFGTIVLHVTPESALGGPLAWVQNGDRIRISVSQRQLEWLVSPQELARRQSSQPVRPPHAERGYRKLYLQSVLQADQGADFDFLRHPGPIPRYREKAKTTAAGRHQPETGPSVALTSGARACQ